MPETHDKEGVLMKIELTHVYVRRVLAAASTVSMFAWAAFDVSWWAPIAANETDIFRGIMMSVFHLGAFAQWLVNDRP